MAKKRLKSKQRRHAAERSALQLVHYEVTDEPIMTEAYKRLPENVKDKLEQLHDLIERQPQDALPELLALRTQYPNLEQISNYLVVAQMASSQTKAAKAQILENYQRHPDYLFARIHYAELCLSERNYDQIAKIFDHKFDLSLLYPRRRRFHISEVVGFLGVIGPYFHATGSHELAEKSYQVLEQLVPDHPYTRTLKRKLYPGLLRRLFMRLFGTKEHKKP